jgi:hypothetical protein
MKHEQSRLGLLRVKLGALAGLTILLGKRHREGGMKRERALQVVLVLVGLFYSVSGYLLFDDLWHERWLSHHGDVMPMFLSLMAALGPCLLIAARHPANHRLMIFCGALSSLAHASTMAIQSAQALSHGLHRQDSPWDIIIFAVIGLVLLALFPRESDMIHAVSKSMKRGLLDAPENGLAYQQ